METATDKSAQSVSSSILDGLVLPSLARGEGEWGRICSFNDATTMHTLVFLITCSLHDSPDSEHLSHGVAHRNY